MVAVSVEIVLFAIRSGIKLGQQMRQAYVDSTKNRELVLPLPNFFGKTDITSALDYFETDGKAHVKDASRLAELLKKHHPPESVLSSEEEKDVIIFYKEFFYCDCINKGYSPAEAGNLLNVDDFNKLLTIRQWKRGEFPNPSTLQRLAGTFIEIGIDYFVNVPGALNKDSRQGKAIAGFLQGMSEIHFTEVQLGEIPGRLFVAAVETISENAGLLSADVKVQELIAVATKTISTNIVSRLEQLRKSGDSDLVKEERIGAWAELVFRSLLSSSGALVLSNPKKYLGVDEGQSVLVSQVGDAILGLVLDDSHVRLDRLFSRDGLEKVTKSALAVVGEHPEILQLSDNMGLQKLLSAVATQLSQYDTLLTPGLLPELTRLILDKTGENLALFWPDFAHDPKRHLLLTAAGTTLDILTRKPTDNQQWEPRLSPAEVLVVAETVFDEFTTNPAWLLDDAGQINDNLRIALEAAVGVLRNRADNRLTTATAVDVLRTVLSKVGSRKEFLDKIPVGTGGDKETLFAAVLDAIFSTVFDNHLDERAAWQVVRTEAISVLVNTSLAELAKVPLNPGKVTIFETFIRKQMNKLANGEPFDLPAFGENLQKVLVTG